MRIKPDEQKRINKFYNDLLAKHGTKSAKTLDWIKVQDQLLRFKVLCNIGDINKRSVLDVGCGVGDLYAYLSLHFDNFKYLGIDINPVFIEKAYEKYPKAKFSVGEIFDVTKNFDYIFASGSLSFNFPGAEKYYFDSIRKMYALAKCGVAFNMLDSRFYSETKVYKVYNYKDIAKFCATITDKYEIILGYQEGDFTVFLKK